MELEVVPSEWVKNMCKKIAHLTKVIYNLNVRIGDQDFTIETLKQSHEEQVRKLTSKLKYETEQYKIKAKCEEILQKEVTLLKNQLTEESKMRKDAETNFMKLKAALENKSSRASRLLSRQINTKKKEVLKKLEELQNLQKQFEWEYGDKSEDSDDSTIGQNCEQKITKQNIHLELREEEVRVLKDKYDKINQEKLELIQSYELRLNAMRTLYQKFVASHSCTENGHCSDLTQRETQKGKQTENTSNQNDGVLMQKRVDELLQNLTQSEEQAERYRRTIRELKDTVTTKDKQIDVMNEQMCIMKEDLSRITPRLRHAESSLSNLRENCSRQAQEILAKTYEIEALQNSNEMLEATVMSLRSEMGELKQQHEESLQRNKELQLAQQLLEPVLSASKIEFLIKSGDSKDDKLRNNSNEKCKEIKNAIQEKELKINGN